MRRLFQLLGDHAGPEYKGTLRQLVEMAELLARGHVHPSEYLLYGLSRRDVARTDVATYVSNRSHWEDHILALNDPAWRQLMDNKWLFHLHFGGVVPLPRLLGVYEPAVGITGYRQTPTDAPSLETLIRTESLRSIVLKPVAGTHGDGIVVVPRVEATPNGLVHRLNDGSRLSSEALLASLVNPQSPDDPGLWLIEERVSQHPMLEEIAPSTTNTVRLVTLRTGRDVVMLLACLRLGRHGSLVDNYSQGGYCVAVDPETGRIGHGKRKDTPGARLESTHVDSGVRFTGLEIPLWQDVVEACVSAAHAAPGLRTVGWDVVVTREGPVVIEGNWDWGLMMWQACAGGILRGHTLDALRRAGLDVTPERLPPFRPARAVSSLLGAW